MNILTLVLSALLALSAAAAQAQCGPGQGGCSGHGSALGASRPKAGFPGTKATNRVCPVMGREVKPGRDREVVIRGNSYVVCCDGCGPAMAKDPDRYLDEGGQPRNAPKKTPKKGVRQPAPPPSRQEGHQH